MYKGSLRGSILFIVRILFLVFLRQSLQITYSSSIGSMSAFKCMSTSSKIAYPNPFVQMQHVLKKLNRLVLMVDNGMVGLAAISNKGTWTLLGLIVKIKSDFDFGISLVS
jgi:hypothetical protein